MASLPPSPSESSIPPPSAQPNLYMQELHHNSHKPIRTAFDDYARSPKRLQSFGKKDLAKPRRKIFDPWTMSTTGHQRADNSLARSVSWRESRTMKLAHQFADTTGTGGKRIADTVGAGSTAFGKDGRLENGGWARGAPGLRRSGQLSIQESLARSKVKNPLTSTSKAGAQRQQNLVKAAGVMPDVALIQKAEQAGEVATVPTEEDEPDTEKKPLIFRHLTFFINGSTYPHVSDHRLKQLLRQHGGNISLGLARKTVTHVILGKPNDSATHSGAGGGLAAGKIQKEVSTVRGSRVKYVSAAWAMDSIRAGKRLPEEPYVPLKVAPRGQQSVTEVYREKRENETWWDWL